MINDRLVDAGELPLAVRDFGGTGTPLLLLHDAGANLAHLTVLARRLRPAHRVVAVDLRGHGRSGDGGWTAEAALADLAAVAVHLDLDRPAVVGHGLGGVLAALWGQRHPECPGVVNLDGGPPPLHPERLPGLADPVGELARARAARTAELAARDRPLDPADLPDLVEREQMAARDRGANEKVWIEGFRRNLAHHDGVTTLRPTATALAGTDALLAAVDLGVLHAHVTCPQLVVFASQDPPPFAELAAAHRRYLFEQVRAVAGGVPSLRYTRLADASHAMVVEQPERLAGLVEDFLTGM